VVPVGIAHCKDLGEGERHHSDHGRPGAHPRKPAFAESG
jgi:hypothetical protein